MCEPARTMAITSDCVFHNFILFTVIVTTVVHSWTVTTVPESVTVAELDSVSVICSTDYTGGDVVFEWTGPNSGRHLEFNGANLEIHSANAVDHGGNFTCSAYGGDQHDLIGLAILRVIVKYAPRWDKASVPVSAADVESPGELTCVVHAEPLPVRFYWTTPNGRTISASMPADGFSLTSYDSRSVLRVHRLLESDYGNYTCVASNDLGTRSFKLSMQRPGRPDSPDECQYVSSTGDSVTVECTDGFDGGQSVTYVVYAIPSNSAATITCSGSASVGKVDSLKTDRLSTGLFRLTVGRLAPQRKYDLHIYAQNSYGCSSVSFFIAVETTADSAQQSSSASIGVTAIAITLLVVLLLVAVVIKRCRHLREQRKYPFYRPHDLRTRSQQNLISEDSYFDTSS